MAEPIDHLAAVGELADGLRALGLDPVLVGGMAMVIIGSRRVTRDFDFLIPHPADRLRTMIDLFYERGLELAARLTPAGDISATIGRRAVATLRLQIDAPSSAYFYNASTGLRVDLLFDFPLAASDLAARATRTKIRSYLFDVASDADMLRLKQLARDARTAPGDAEDIAFLEARLRSPQRNE
jgi:hypothetical protein